MNPQLVKYGFKNNLTELTFIQISKHCFNFVCAAWNKVAKFTKKGRKENRTVYKFHC